MENGTVRKMVTSLEAPVSYQLPIGDSLLAINDLLGKEITIEFSGTIICTSCGRKIKKSFNQGYCYPCFKRLASCDQCIVRPEICHYHKGTCRDPDWAKSFCFQPHIVYLANSSGLKVGVTREEQIPTRWIDQGATQALPIYLVGARRDAGRLESIIRQTVSDRTDWRKMLKGSPEKLNLLQEKNRILSAIRSEIRNETAQKDFDNFLELENSNPVEICYPVEKYPSKVTALNLDKTSLVKGRLWGIKGQYLILDKGVLNVRKIGGYEISISY